MKHFDEIGEALKRLLSEIDAAGGDRNGVDFAIGDSVQNAKFRIPCAFLTRNEEILPEE
jgi:hypothetical protein